MKQKIQIPIEYKRLFDNDWREAAVYGGRYSLKSHTVARVLLIMGRMKQMRFGCFREFQNSIADSSHQLLKDLINQYQLYDYKVTDNSIINSVNGTDFLFKGLHHNEQSIKSIEGIDIAWCFMAGTQVDGKPIETLRPGDYVKSFNHLTNKIEYRKVLRATKRKTPKKLYKVLVQHGLHSIILTEEHPIYIKGKGYVPVSNIKNGDTILYEETNSVLREYRVDSIEIQKQEDIKRLQLSDGGNYVYNIEVEVNNNYFANGILSHNCEEAQSISTKSLEVLTPTVRKPGSKLIYTYNRLLEQDPVHVRLVIEGRPNTLIINANYDIAEKYGWLPKVVKDEIEDDRINRPALYKHKWLGEPNSLERRVYQGWKRIETVPHEARLIRRGLDFGYSKDPTAVIAIYEYNGGYILDEELYRKGMKNNDIGAFLKNVEELNTLVVGDSSEPKSIADLQEQGINILGVKKIGEKDEKGNKKSFKQYMIDFVKQKKISYTARSKNLEQEYLTYYHKEDKDGNILNDPEDGNDHAMDALGYGFMGIRPEKKIDIPAYVPTNFMTQ